MPKPSYIIIGTQRGGTTSLHNLLRAHPEIARSGKPRREIHFFDYPHHWSMGRKWYEDRLTPVEGDPGRLVGDKTPTLLDHELAPERVMKLYPRVKLIAILREPAARAYSDYCKIRRKGRESEKIFEGALGAEPRRLADERDHGRRFWKSHYFGSSHHVRSYFWRGRYIEHLNRWHDTSQKEGPLSLLLLRSEDIWRGDEAAIASVFEFLELDPLREIKLPHMQSLAGLYPAPHPETMADLRKKYRPFNEQLARAMVDDKWLWEDIDHD